LAIRLTCAEIRLGIDLPAYQADVTVVVPLVYVALKAARFVELFGLRGDRHTASIFPRILAPDDALVVFGAVLLKRVAALVGWIGGAKKDRRLGARLAVPA